MKDVIIHNTYNSNKNTELQSRINTLDYLFPNDVTDTNNVSTSNKIKPFKGNKISEVVLRVMHKYFGLELKFTKYK